jgi:hypothetical protein
VVEVMAQGMTDTTGTGIRDTTAEHQATTIVLLARKLASLNFDFHFWPTSDNRIYCEIFRTHVAYKLYQLAVPFIQKVYMEQHVLSTRATRQ